MPVRPTLFPIKIVKIEADDDAKGDESARARTTVVCSVCGEKGNAQSLHRQMVFGPIRLSAEMKMAPYFCQEQYKNWWRAVSRGCCRKDVFSCQKDAKASSPEALEYFNNQAEDPDQFKEFIMRYKMQCPSRGHGRPRHLFDWAQELQTHSKESSEGFEGEMMGFDQFVAWGKVKHNATHEQALAHWLEIESNTPVEKRDIEGFGANREPGRARLPIVTKVHGFSGSRPFLGQVGN